MSILKLPLALAITAVVLAGCAKTPIATTVSSPAPGPRAATRPVAPTPKTAAARHVVAAAPRPEEFKPVAALKDVHFDFDRYDIRAEDRKLLDANAAWLKDNARTLVLIEGHADERGTNEYNMALGDRRAKATRDYLAGQGVQASRISVISYGEERPLCTERTEACWAQNRRGHFLVKPE